MTVHFSLLISKVDNATDVSFELLSITIAANVTGDPYCTAFTGPAIRPVIPSAAQSVATHTMAQMMRRVCIFF
jgi:hypothetical protein